MLFTKDIWNCYSKNKCSSKFILNRLSKHKSLIISIPLRYPYIYNLNVLKAIKKPCSFYGAGQKAHTMVEKER